MRFRGFGILGRLAVRPGPTTGWGLSCGAARCTMSQHDDESPGTPEEIAARRDEVLRRMIATPPKPHKDEPPKRASTAKRKKQKAKA